MPDAADRDQPRSLRQLLADWAEVAGDDGPGPPTYDGQDRQLSGLEEHSDLVKPGSVFVARVRVTGDGHAYIPRAVANGATVVIGQRPPEELADAVPAEVVYLPVPDSALANAWLAAAWHGFPAQQLVTIGVTGTDGKTTTCNMLLAMLAAAGIQCGLLSTVHAVIGDHKEALALHVTTPEAPVVQRYLRRMVDSGMSHAILESTSHGLAQHRVGAVPFDIAVVTNITHEHLDYHGDFEGYFRAKARLFQNLTRSRPISPRFPMAPAKAALAPTAILNRDDDSYDRLAALAPPRILDYGVDRPAMVMGQRIVTAPDHTALELILPDQAPLPVRSNMVGYFNVYNMLAAAAAGHALGLAPENLRAGLAALRGLTGRMQRIDHGQPFLVLVDFAHTPYALAEALRTGRRMLAGASPGGGLVPDEPRSPGRLVVVFGSAGERDPAKRRLMAETAAREADLTILTAEDPRTESLDGILTVMAAGCTDQGGREGQTFWRSRDRGRAIHFALSQAQAGDLVLICGKGHEQSMCFGRTEFPWDDIEATATALNAVLAGAPMPDLGLPTFAEPEPHGPA